MSPDQGASMVATLDDNPVELPEHIAQKIVQPEVWADEKVLHETFAWMRANNPLGKAVLPGFDPFWIVTKYSDIMEISRQNHLFHSGDLSAVLMPRQAYEALSGGADSEPVHRSIVYMDPPEHGRYRMLTQAWFQPGSVKKREEHIRQIARKTVERMRVQNGHCDFVGDVAVHYPLEVIMQILGIPSDYYARVLRFTQEIFSVADEDLGRQDDKDGFSLGSDKVFADFNAFLRPFHEDRKANPRDDVMSIIAAAKINGEPVPEIEALSYYITIATAGHDTTSSTSATALWALATQPGLLQKLKADPSGIPTLLDEALRWTTPVRHFMRSAVEDYTLSGRHIAKGDWLMLCYPSGNRDEDIFEAPMEFRADRTPNKQIAFGFGAHLCLGQHLAKLELRILIEELVQSLESIELAGEPAFIKAIFVGGLKKLPLKYTMS